MNRIRVAGALTFAVFVFGCDGGNDSNESGGGGIGAGPPVISGTLYAFGGTGSPAQDGAEPKGTLTAVTVGGGSVLFGRTAIGGTDGCGIVFAVNPDGTNYNVQYRFGGSDGCDPRHDAMVLNPNDGKLYATTQGLNQNNNATYGNWGQVFSFAPGAAIPYPINAVHTFANPSPTKSPFDGAEQRSSFSVDPVSGLLYGQSASGGANGVGMLYALSTDGSRFIDHHDFAKDDGTDPHGRIVLDNGVLYGITRSNGRLPSDASGSSKTGFGSVFAYTLTSPLANGPVSVLHVFTGAPDDGASSDHGYLTPVTVDGRTILFGMTQCGGAGPKNASCKGNGDGSGVIFQIDPTAAPGSGAAFNIVHSFQAASSTDGALPYGSLMYDGTHLYGTTSAGGAHGNGTVFRFAPVAMGGTATPTLLYQFGANATDGAKPIDNVILVGTTLYGMTVYGGAGVSGSPGSSGNGTIFAVPLPD